MAIKYICYDLRRFAPKFVEIPNFMEESTMYQIPVTLTDYPKQKPADDSKLGFGKVFSDHMFIMDYELGRGWYDARVVPYGPFTMDPACTVFHYAQEIFEGMKCYRRKDGGLQLFRPRDNFERMNRSATRMGMPTIDVEQALAGLLALLKADADWVPSTPGTSLYIRPTMIATDVMLGVHASHTYRFYIICSPSGAYYAKGLAPVGIYVEPELVRAVKGGVGFTKTGGNYAASILAGDIAEKNGYEQVLWLDGKENKYIEEVGSMNMFFKFRDVLVTPPLLGSILGGITRDSIIKLARHMGVPVDERRITVQDVFDASQRGELEEAFGSGTAAVVSPVGRLAWKGQEILISDGKIGPLTQKFYDTLTGIQYGELEDPFGWVLRVD